MLKIGGYLTVIILLFRKYSAESFALRYSSHPFDVSTVPFHRNIQSQRLIYRFPNDNKNKQDSKIARRELNDSPFRLSSHPNHSCGFSTSLSIDFGLVAIISYISKQIHQYVSKSTNIIDTTMISFALSSLVTNILPKRGLASPASQSLAWSVLLPASLVLSIWSATTPTYSSEASALKLRNQGKRSRFSFIPMTMAFVFGSIGSVVGSIIAGITVSKHYKELLEICPCLTASYIGGTANFFETATILNLQSKYPKVITDIAGIDIGIMVLYFYALQRLRVSEGLRLRWNKGANAPADNDYNERFVSKETSVFTAGESRISSCLLAFSVCVALLSKYLQTLVPIAGISILISTALAFLLRNGIFRAMRIIAAEESFRRNCTQMSAVLNDLFYCLIGLSLDFNSLKSLGFPAMQLMLFILFIHLSTIYTGSYIWNSLLLFIQSKAKKSSKMDHLLIGIDEVAIAR